jgi:hypothetical protein
MKSIKDKILQRIKKKKAGYAFSAKDFLEEFKRYEVDVALSTLAKEGVIRRIIPGIYELVHQTKILGIGIDVVSDFYNVAEALARKFNWRIFPSGNTALNHLGLSTQIPGRICLLSDGPSRTYDVKGMEIEFQHVSQHELLFKHQESVLVVQALKALGKEHLNEKVIRLLRRRYPKKLWKKISQDTCKSCGWIHDFIQIVSEQGENDIMRKFEAIDDEQ